MAAEFRKIEECHIHKQHQVQAQRKDDKDFRYLRLPNVSAEEKEKLYAVFQQQEEGGPENMLCGNILMKKQQQERDRRENTVARDEIIIHPTHIIHGQTKDTRQQIEYKHRITISSVELLHTVRRKGKGQEIHTVQAQDNIGAPSAFPRQEIHDNQYKRKIAQ